MELHRDLTSYSMRIRRNRDWFKMMKTGGSIGRIIYESIGFLWL